MTVQLVLFKLPRRLDPGEHPMCLDCGCLDFQGTYGPSQLESIEVGGEEYTVRLSDQWLCRTHSADRWATWLRMREALPARRRRLRAFRLAAEQGHRGHLNQDLFAVAEQWLRDGFTEEG